MQLKFPEKTGGGFHVARRAMKTYVAEPSRPCTWQKNVGDWTATFAGGHLQQDREAVYVASSFSTPSPRSSVRGLAA